MNVLRSLFLALIFLVVVPNLPTAQTVKLGTLAPEGSPWYNIIRDMAEDWQNATDGEIEFRIYPGGVAGDDPDMVRKMRIGQLDAAVLSVTGLYDITPVIQALAMPMMLASYDEFDYVLERMAPQLEAILEEKGFKVLNWGDAGWVHFFSQSPVVSPDDMRAMRLFAWTGYTAYIEAWKDAGFQPVPLASTEIHTGLESGLINAFPATPIAALSYQWFGLANNMTKVNWAPLIGATVITERKWNSIPDELKPKLLEAAANAGARTRNETRQLSDEAVEVMEEYGLVVHDVAPDIVAQWESDAEAGWSKIIDAGVPESAVAEVQQIRDEYRALNPTE